MMGRDANVYEGFGKNLKRARVRSGMSQRDLASRAGVAIATISRYESGEMNPSPRVINNVAEVFGCSIGDLIDGSFLDTQPDNSDTSRAKKIEVIIKVDGTEVCKWSSISME